LISVVVNQKAGSRNEEAPRRIEQACARAGLDARLIVADGSTLAAAADRAAAAGDVLVAAGGDGTVSTVAAAAAATGRTFGVIPLGTLNHFAKDAGIPLDLDAAVRTIADGHVDPIDIAMANGTTFVNNLSAGLYPRIVRERQQAQRDGHTKWTAFAMGLARAWIDFRPFTVRLTLDGIERVVATPFVFVGNGEYVTEGLDVGRRSSIANGRLSIYTAPECTRAEMLALIVRALAGRLTRDVALEALTATEVTIEPAMRRPTLAKDGELVTMASPIRCTVRPGALRTFRPLPAG
jgi:diacylglycerol kinase family enzyme